MIIRIIEDTNEKREIIGICDSAFTRPLKKRKNFEDIFSKIDRFAAFFGAFEDLEAVGYAAVYANDTVTQTAFISVINVVKKMQGKHIGSALMRRSIDYALNNGMTNLRLEVLKEDTKAIGFYERWGFEYEKDASGESFHLIKRLI